MHIKIRRTFVVVEERREEAGRVSNLPLRKVAAVAVVENPYAGRYVEDLKPMIEGSVPLGKELGALALSAIGQLRGAELRQGRHRRPRRRAGARQRAPDHDVRQSDPRSASAAARPGFRRLRRKAAPARAIDIPMNHKDDVYVRSHYDGMTLVLPDAPMPDEVAVIFCLANRGRLNARVGGLTPRRRRRAQSARSRRHESRDLQYRRKFSPAISPRRSPPATRSSSTTARSSRSAPAATRPIATWRSTPAA